MISRRLTVAMDHGSYNSAIAVMTPAGPEIITFGSKDQKMYPSYVFIYKNKRILTGLAARNAALKDFEEGDFQAFYKPCLGQSTLFPFVKAGIVKTPVELGADVMGAMLEACRAAKREKIYGAVVTVPASFEQSRADATREAALAAGLRYVSLLQEPVAAALAYGFDAREMKDQIWCVVDLGGGTLDLSLVMVRGGQITSPANCQLGDNFSGGGHWDKAIAMYIIHERLEKARGFKLASLTVNKNSSAWFRLLLAVEEAKIALSEREEAVVHVDGVLCKDDLGKEVRVDESLSRSQLESLVSPFVETACAKVLDLLHKKGLKRTDVSRLILVGGPTQMPYFRERLKSVGIPLDTTIDPMTAVVRGAALYSATQQIPADIFESIQEEEKGVNGGGSAVRLKIEAPGSSQAPIAPIQGHLSGPANAAACTIEIVRRDGGWSSGRIPISEDGYFEVDALLVVRGRPYCSEFSVKAFDPRGALLVEQDHLQIWHPFPETVFALPHPLLVELADNRTSELMAGGTQLPGEGQDSFVTVKEIKAIPLSDLLKNLKERVNTLFAFMQGNASSSFADDSAKDLKAKLPDLEGKVREAARPDGDERSAREDLGAALGEVDKLEQRLVNQGLKLDLTKRPLLDVLRIRILEGVPNAFGEVQEAANCNMLIGELVIPATSLRRNLAVGSEAVVSISVDESRAVTVRTFVPLLDDEFEARLQSSSHGLTVADAEKRLADTEKRLASVQATQKTQPLPEVEQGLKRIQQLDLIGSIRRAIDLGKSGDVQSVERAIMGALALQGTAEQLEQMQLKPRVRGDLKRLRELEAIFDPQLDRDLLADFEKRLDSTPPGSALQTLASEIRGKDKSVRIERGLKMLLRIGALMMALGKNTVTLTTSQRATFDAAESFWSGRLKEKDALEGLDNAGFEKAWKWHKAMDSWFTQEKWHQIEDAFMSELRKAGGSIGSGPGSAAGNPWEILIKKK
jgi:actin-like ATPase involved in cell morphogenesis